MITAITTLIVCFLIGAQIGRKTKTDERENPLWTLGEYPTDEVIDRTWRLALAFQTLDMTILNICDNTMSMADMFALVIDLWVQDQDQMLADGLLNGVLDHMEKDEYHTTWVDACKDFGLETNEDGYMVVVDSSHPTK